jgi:hypothetical protein
MNYTTNNPGDLLAVASALISAIVCGLIMLH